MKQFHNFLFVCIFASLCSVLACKQNEKVVQDDSEHPEDSTAVAIVDPRIVDTSLSTEERIEAIISNMTLEEKVLQLDGNYPPGIPRLGLDEYFFGNEALHGVVRPGKATVFPQAIGMGATWNTNLIHEVATAISDEARAKHNETHGKMMLKRSCGLLTFWSPTINMVRDPRWGRTAETYGEDPYLTSQLGLSFVTGLQGDHPKYKKVIATPKHFVANNEEHNRFECKAEIPEKVLREYYLPAFKTAIVEGKAGSIMSAYNAVNGYPCTANKWLLTDLLRNEWGFDGYVVTDCGAIEHLYGAHKFAKTKGEAAVLAVNAGVDLECGNIYRAELLNKVKSGEISEKRLDSSMAKILKAKFELGMLDPDESVPYNQISPEVVGSKKHQELALRTAEESIVLLKNENILPIQTNKVKKIAVVGPNAGVSQFGDYSGIPVNPAVTPIDGIQALAEQKGVKILYAPWNGDTNDADYQYIPLKRLASSNEENAEPGIKATYYHGSNDIWGEVKPSVERVEEKINYDSQLNIIDTAIPEGKFSVKWETFFTAPVTGTYKFALTANDGMRFKIDWKPVIDEWYTGEKRTAKATAHFEKGKRYQFHIEHFHANGPVFFDFKMLIQPEGKIVPYEKELQIAKESDLVVAVLGLGQTHEREGQDKENLDLPKDQKDFIKKIKAVNPNTVVVLVNGSPLTLKWCKANVPAILEAWYPGEQGGNAIANVLFGTYNPAGRLPVTFYEDESKLPDFNDYDIRKGRTYMYYQGTPTYEFGYGLSYTSFEYDNLKVQHDNNHIEVSFAIRNTGNWDGDEVAQVYLRYTDDSKAPMQLKGFRRKHIKRGATEQLTVSIPKEKLQTWNTKNKNWEFQPGRYEVLVGSSSKKIHLETNQVL